MQQVFDLLPSLCPKDVSSRVAAAPTEPQNGGSAVASEQRNPHRESRAPLALLTNDHPLRSSPLVKAKPHARVLTRRAFHRMGAGWGERLHQVRARAIRGPHARGEWYWQALVYRDGGSHTVWTGWGTISAVEQTLAKLVASGGVEAGRTAPTASMETVQNLMEVWVAWKENNARIAPSTRRNCKTAARHVVTEVGKVRLDRVGLETLESYADLRVRGGAATGTVKNEIGALRSAWRWGRQRGLCPDHGLPPLPIKVKPARNRRTPTPGDVGGVIASLDGWPRLAVILLWATGARVGEIAALTWQGVDLDNEELMLAGKTGSRTVPLAPFAVSELRALAEQRPCRPEDTVLGVLPETAAGGLRCRFLPRACAQAGVPRFTAHGLRRAAVDAFLRAGVDVGTAAAILGHSPKVMLEHYRQASRADCRDAIRRAGLGRTPSGKVVNIR